MQRTEIRDLEVLRISCNMRHLSFLPTVHTNKMLFILAPKSLVYRLYGLSRLPGVEKEDQKAYSLSTGFVPRHRANKARQFAGTDDGRGEPNGGRPRGRRFQGHDSTRKSNYKESSRIVYHPIWGGWSRAKNYNKTIPMSSGIQTRNILYNQTDIA